MSEGEPVMIYITGDCHKVFSRFALESFPEQKYMTKEDYVIICGDFGGVWCRRNEGEYNLDDFDLDWLEDKPFTTLFVDGNHENFDELYKYPVKEWHGGRVHELRPSVLHLMRGEIYEISGKKFFAFGGAQSHDISDGIIEWDENDEWKTKAAEWKKAGKAFRVNHFSWWQEELPADEEIQCAYRNLEKHDYKVDYIATHCCPNSVLYEYVKKRFHDKELAKKYGDKNVLTDFFDELNERVEFDKWFFGHHHDDMSIRDKYFLLYNQILRIV